MELILTDEEKAVDSWLGWDDETVGKAARALALILVENEPNKMLYAHAAALMLCKIASEVNATETTITENGVTSKGQELGHFRITIERSDTPWESEPVEAVFDGEKLTAYRVAIRDGIVVVPNDGEALRTRLAHTGIETK